MTRSLVAIRHLPLPGVAGLCYGRSDLPPDVAATTAAAAALSARLPRWPVVSSPARRCRLLAESLAERLQTTFACDERWSEMHFGEWEQCRWDTLPRDALDRWAADPLGYRPPAGESALELFARVASAVDALHDDVIVVTHGGPIRALWHLHGGLPPLEASARPVPHGVPIGFGPGARQALRRPVRPG